MFTLYRIVERSVAESVPGRTSILFRMGTLLSKQCLLRNSTAPLFSFPLLKVERSVSDRFLKRSESRLNTSNRAEIAAEPRFGK